MLGLPALTELCALEPKRSHTQPKTPSNDNRDADEGSDVHFISQFFTVQLLIIALGCFTWKVQKLEHHFVTLSFWFCLNKVLKRHWGNTVARGKGLI